MKREHKKISKNEACPQCFRPRAACFCGRVTALNSSLTVLILQHPQERYKQLNSASLAHAMLDKSVLRVGLSWRNLSHALGKDTDPKHWGVLYLKGRGETGKPMEVFDNKKRPLAAIPALTGLVAIDGSWKQAKALWWRNPWLLRLSRIMLNPNMASRRPQTKREGLATIEAVALALECLGEAPSLSDALLKNYEEIIIAPSLSTISPASSTGAAAST
jgi:DTW domain-containing protein